MASAVAEAFTASAVAEDSVVVEASMEAVEDSMVGGRR